MSNTVLRCHPSITAITIDGVPYVPASGLITVPSDDASALFANAGANLLQGPIALAIPPSAPNT